MHTSFKKVKHLQQKLNKKIKLIKRYKSGDERSDVQATKIIPTVS